MATYIYETKESLDSIQKYLNDVSKALSDRNIDSTTVKDITWTSDTMKNTAVGLTAGAGATVGAGTIGAGGLALGASSLAAGSIAVPALVALLPIAAVFGGIIGALLMHFKNKEEKERIQNELILYKEAVKKQNIIVGEISDMKERMDRKEASYEELYKRYLLLGEMNKKLMEYLRNLETDLRVAKVVQ